MTAHVELDALPVELGLGAIARVREPDADLPGGWRASGG